MIARLFYVICDRCAEQTEPATTAITARMASTKAGWSLVRDAISTLDYCPKCTGTPVVAAHTEITRLWVCPECEQGKHANCDGWAWDFDADEKTQCQCPAVHP